MADTFLYFAYGSNMFTHRLTDRTPSAVAVGTAFVGGRRLTFAKVSSDGSSKCDIEETENPADRVHGVPSGLFPQRSQASTMRRDSATAAAKEKSKR